MSGFTVLQSLTILKFVTKWQPFQYDVKLETITSYIIIFNKAFVKKFVKKNLLFNLKSCNLFQGLVFCQPLSSLISCY